MTTNLAVTFGAKWPWLMRGFSLLPSPSGTLAHFLARFLMRFGEMINAAIGEALMDGEREEEEEEEDAAGGREAGTVSADDGLRAWSCKKCPRPRPLVRAPSEHSFLHSRRARQCLISSFPTRLESCDFDITRSLFGMSES